MWLADPVTGLSAMDRYWAEVDKWNEEADAWFEEAERFVLELRRDRAVKYQVTANHSGRWTRERPRSVSDPGWLSVVTGCMFSALSLQVPDTLPRAI